jgi:hypothetical protein
MLYLTVVNLTTQTQANAAQASGTETEGFRNIGEVYKFMITYYQNPQPNRLAPALKTVVESELMDRATLADEIQFAGFFGYAGRSEPNVIEDYKNLFAPAAHNQRLFILMILQICGNKNVEEYFRNELKAGRFINQQRQIENMLAAGLPMKTEIFLKVIGPAGRVHLLFGEYMATGRTTVIDELINSLGYENPGMSADDVKNAKYNAKNALSGMCALYPDVTAICKQRLEITKGDAKTNLEEIIDSIDGSISAQRIIENPPEIKVVSGPKVWALGCAAVLMERNYCRHDILATNPFTKAGVYGQRKSLDDWWGIRTKKDLLDALESLEKSGHRSSFDKMAAKVTPLTDEQFKALTDVYKDDMQTLQEMRVARRYAARLAGRSILGWDYSRYICLCRWGYTVGLLSEQEAWDKIMPIAQKLQQRFTSWEDLGCNYLIGRQFWSYKQTVENGALYEDAFQRLMDITSSPWNKYPWNMNLDDANDANNANDSNETGKN